MRDEYLLTSCSNTTLGSRPSEGLRWWVRIRVRVGSGLALDKEL